VVVDAGLARGRASTPPAGWSGSKPCASPPTSAEQRRGRAGRARAGRLLPAVDGLRARHLRAHAPPEIAQADLAPLALELAAWGTPTPPPSAGSTPRPRTPSPRPAPSSPSSARSTRPAASPPTAAPWHPRDAPPAGAPPPARPRAGPRRHRGPAGGPPPGARPLRSNGPEPPPADLRLRLDLLRDRETDVFHGAGAPRRRQPGAPGRPPPAAPPRHPRRRQRRRGRGAPPRPRLPGPRRHSSASAGRYRLRSGRPAALPSNDPLADRGPRRRPPRRHGAEARIFLAAPLSLDDLRTQFGGH
jgi:ATP-dependent helicase HrpB